VGALELLRISPLILTWEAAAAATWSSVIIARIAANRFSQSMNNHGGKRRATNAVVPVERSIFVKVNFNHLKASH